MKPDHRLDQISVVTLPDVRVAKRVHRGDPALLGDSIGEFIAWRRASGLPPKASATYNVFYGDPANVAPADFRLDLCAATDQDIAQNEYGVIADVIPGGRFAQLTHMGSDETLGLSFNFLFSSWLPQSGEVLRDEPLFARRVAFFPDVPEHEAVTELYLPLR